MANKPQPDVNGAPQQDVSTKELAQRWHVSPGTVAKYCKEGKIPGAMKLPDNHWAIPANTPKPPTDAALRKMLFLTLQLKNNPSFGIDYDALGVEPAHLPEAYRYLADLHLLTLPDPLCEADRIPYAAVLTPRGLRLLQGNSEKTALPTGTDTLQKAVLSWGPPIIQLITELLKAITR